MRRFFATLLIFCLVFMMIGCSGGKDSGNGTPGTGDPVESPGEDAGKGPGDEPVDLDAFFEIEEIQDLVKNFKELSYSFSDAENVLTVTYNYLGQDTVGGTTADHFTISFAEKNDSTDVEIWMSSGGEVLKAEFDGEDLGPMAPMAVAFVHVVLIPFTYGSEWEGAFTQSGYQRLGWTISRQERESKNFGSGSTTVHRYSFKAKEPGTGKDVDYSFEVAEISGRSMFVGWEVEFDQSLSSFTVDRVVPR